MHPHGIIRAVIARHGTIIDLNESPEILIDILQRLHLADDPDGGTPAGAPPPPPPPPTSAVSDIESTTQELTRETLTLRREVGALRASLEHN